MNSNISEPVDYETKEHNDFFNALDDRFNILTPINPVRESRRIKSNCSANMSYINDMLDTLGLEKVCDFCFCNAYKHLLLANQEDKINNLMKARDFIDQYLQLCLEE